MLSDWQDQREKSEAPEVRPGFDRKPGLSDAGIRAMQGDADAPADAQPEPTSTMPPGEQPDTAGPAASPPDHIPQGAFGEAGEAARAETGAEKPEVKYFHPGGPEGLGR